MAAQRKPRFKEKGERFNVTGKFSADHKKVYEERAAALGIPLTDYLAYVMARAHGLEVPSYIRPAGDESGSQEVLPLSA